MHVSVTQTNFPSSLSENYQYDADNKLTQKTDRKECVCGTWKDREVKIPILPLMEDRDFNLSEFTWPTNIFDERAAAICI